MKILQVGFGKIGQVVAKLLSRDGRFSVTVVDKHHNDAAVLAPIEFIQADITDGSALRSLANGAVAIVSTAPYYLNPAIAQLARSIDAHYFDLTESLESTAALREIAKGAKTAFVPNCGIAPGFICIISSHIISKFDVVKSVRLRAGCIPKLHTNRLGYNKMWSIDGVVHEYTSPCQAIERGELVKVPPMSNLELQVVEDLRLEAFSTSGGLGTLPETFQGKIEEMNYKSLRYPGHCELMRFLLEDLGYGERPSELVALLNRSLVETLEDLMVVYVHVSGQRLGRLNEQSFSCIFRGTGRPCESAIQASTAHAICVLVDLVLSGRLRATGFVKQEDVELKEFLRSPFAGPYQAATALL